MRRVSLALSGPKHLDEVSEVGVGKKKVLVGTDEVLVLHLKVLETGHARAELENLLAQCDDDDPGG